MQLIIFVEYYKDDGIADCEECRDKPASQASLQGMRGKSSCELVQCGEDSNNLFVAQPKGFPIDMVMVELGRVAPARRFDGRIFIFGGTLIEHCSLKLDAIDIKI